MIRDIERVSTPSIREGSFNSPYIRGAVGGAVGGLPPPKLPLEALYMAPLENALSALPLPAVLPGIQDAHALALPRELREWHYGWLQLAISFRHFSIC